MLYLGIDQHSKQLTVALLDQQGSVLRRQQVSTRPERVAEFFRDLATRSEPDGGFMAILEVCGFNDWLVDLMRQVGCREIVLIHPSKRSNRKTDRRDSAALAELLWTNRDRLACGQRARGMRRVVIPTRWEQQLRELTNQRQRLGRLRTKTLNRIQGLLRCHNLTWNAPTKNFQTLAVRRWLRELADGPSVLTRLDRLHLSQWMQQWELYETQIEELNGTINRYARHRRSVTLLRSIPGMGAYSGLALASRIGDIQRFATPRSLANYWGLTPSCANSGETTGRMGPITKDGSRMARFILGQLVLHILRGDAKIRHWYQAIKRRRGSKIARVAVMRRLTMIIWHMLQRKQPYEPNAVRQPEAVAT
jgi:transposase